MMEIGIGNAREENLENGVMDELLFLVPASVDCRTLMMIEFDTQLKSCNKYDD